MKEIDQIFQVLLTTNMAIGGITAALLDNLLPGNKEDRGIIKWRMETANQGQNQEEEFASLSVYDLPYIQNYLNRRKWVQYIPFLPYTKQAPNRVVRALSVSINTAL